MSDHPKHFCLMCGSPLTWRGFPGEREREICLACGWVYYPQLKVGAAAVIEKDGKLLLVRRDQDPWKGCWNLPAGYLEVDEDPRSGAERETFEETGLRVRAGRLLDLYFFDDDPRGSGLLLIYAAEILAGELRGSPEGQELAFFAPPDLPGQLAGAGHDRAVQAWRLSMMSPHANPDHR